MPVTTNSGPETSNDARDRPAFASPRSSAGIVTSLTYRSVVKPWMMMPSATSPATSVICSPTAARNTFGVPYGFGPGAKNGVISVCR